ncbi:hypothetical protein AMTRI_Chr10g228420 [Amborella trichopoda]
MEGRECDCREGRRAGILAELKSLKQQKIEIEKRINVIETQLHDGGHFAEEEGVRDPHHSASCNSASASLTPQDIYRYSRHLLLPSFGVQGRQLNLLKSSILVVGAGGLGSPALLYLAACGVGCIGIVDHDVVELNNLHRQIIHNEAYIGQSKVKSAAEACHGINSTIRIVEYPEALGSQNALDIVSKYDVVIDATDNVSTRYLISDCCVVLGKLTVYHHKGGPCYRCLFPSPPPQAACQNCSDSGVLGVKIRGRSLNCVACGENATFTRDSFQSFDYEKFTQAPFSDKTRPKLSLLPESARISSKEYNECVERGEPHVLVDVRPEHHFMIASLPKSLNLPLSTLQSRLGEIEEALKREESDLSPGSHASLYVVCRRGNDSQRAVDYLHGVGFPLAQDIIGGLESWARDVYPNFPMY